jgi:uncharacterized protein (TIGR03086 family)
MSDIADRYTRLGDQFAATIAGVPEDRWSAPTPCEDWTALDVVRHVVESQGMFESLVGRDIGALPPVDDDPGGAFDAARRVVERHLRDPETADASFDGYFGRSTFAQAVDGFLSFDLVVHRWDLARATGQDETIPADEVERVHAAARGMGEAMRSPKAFGPEQPAPEGADAQTRLLAFLGRRT